MKKLIYIIIALFLFSCSSSHKIHINNDDSAMINFDVTNKKSLIDTLNEWGAIQNNDSIIDIDLLKNELEKNPNIKNVVISSPLNNVYKGNFFVKSINNLFMDGEKEIPKELQLFSLSKNDGNKTLTMRISLENYLYLKDTIPMLKEESIDMLGPDANQDITREEYLDMMSFSLGEEGPKDLISSNIKLEISVDGSILSTNGGIIENNKAIFNIPLLDIILLQKEIIYSITYK
ncbi:MAG: hypothetical protein JXR64_12890 [Spirochaetales bacterium]|nr:hypothetical protein [Spirochaetales bacterium]